MKHLAPGFVFGLRASMTNRCFTQTKKHITANQAIWTPDLGYLPTYVTGMDSDKLAIP